MKDKIITDLGVLRQTSGPTTMVKAKKYNLKYRLLDALKTGWTRGYGLAAIQIGIPVRYGILRVKTRSGWRQVELCNPEVVEMIQPYLARGEGCLSIPNTRVDVQRFREITLICYPERDGRTAAFRGLAAQVIQHEIDHFDGKLIIKREAVPNAT